MENNNYKISENVFFIKRNDGIATYNSIYGNLSLLDRNSYELLKKFKNEPNINNVLKNIKEQNKAEKIINEFIKKKYLIKKDEDELLDFKKFVENRTKNIHEGKEISYIQLVVTNKCNYNCKYCFVNSMYCSKEREKSQKDPDNQMLTKENAKKYINTVIETIKKNNQKNLYILFTGGEPLINWPVIKNVLNEYKNGKKHNLKIGYSIDTNGSLVTDEIAKTLKKFGVKVIVSFDSLNEKARTLSNGKNAVPKIIENIKILHKHGNKIALNTAMTTETIKYFSKEYNYNKDLVDFSLKNGVKEIGVIFELNIFLYKKYSIDEIFKRFWEFYKYAKKHCIIIAGYWHSSFDLMFENKHYKNTRYKTCYATGAILSIEPSGVVYPCKFSSSYMGNMNQFMELLKSDTYAKYAKLPFELKEYCRGCEIENFCSNICLGVRENHFGTISKMHEPTCKLYKMIIKNLIKECDKEKFHVLKIA